MWAWQTSDTSRSHLNMLQILYLDGNEVKISPGVYIGSAMTMFKTPKVRFAWCSHFKPALALFPSDIKPLIYSVFAELKADFYFDSWVVLACFSYSSPFSLLQSLRLPHASLIPFYKPSLAWPWEPNLHHGNHHFRHVPITSPRVCMCSVFVASCWTDGMITMQPMIIVRNLRSSLLQLDSLFPLSLFASRLLSCDGIYGSIMRPESQGCVHFKDPFKN